MVKSMADLENQATEALSPMAGAGEQERLIQNEGGTVVAKTIPYPKKWLMGWLFISFSAMALISHLFPESEDAAAPKNQISTPGLAMFAVFQCAICLMFRTMKQMM